MQTSTHRTTISEEAPSSGVCDRMLFRETGLRQQLYSSTNLPAGLLYFLSVTQRWRANYAFQAVQVPAGEHRVTLRYEDHAIQAGLGVSVVTLAFCVIGWLSPGVRRERVAPSA